MSDTQTMHRRRDASDSSAEDLQRSPTMARLLEALKKGTDIGHYGQFTFATVARHFMETDEIVRLLAKQPDMDETKARALLTHVIERDYNPPHRERILQHQSPDGFQIIDRPHDPDCGNLYRELQFPERVYEDINEYYVEKAEAM